MTPEQKAQTRKTGLGLLFLLAGLIVYSLIVITTRGNQPRPTNMTPFQRMQSR